MHREQILEDSAWGAVESMLDITSCEGYDESAGGSDGVSADAVYDQAFSIAHSHLRDKHGCEPAVASEIAQRVAQRIAQP